MPIVSGHFRLSSFAPQHSLAAQLRTVARVALILMVALVFHFTSRGTWDARHQIDDGGWSAGFFMSQGRAMLRGRLDVSDSDLIGECFRREARCYGYFGITPSVLRIPVMGILRWLGSALTPVYLAAAILLAYWATLQLLQRSLATLGAAGVPRRLVLGYAALGAAALGPGGTLLFVARPAVYEEALAWGIAFVLLAVNHVWGWQAGDRRSLVPAVLFGTAAANARPTAALACGVLGLVVMALAWQSRRASRRVLAAALCLSLLPGITAGAVFWLKLRTPVPSPLLNQQIQEAPFWQDILRRNGQRTTSLIFAPTALVAYFRPDAVAVRPDWPFFDFRFPGEPIWWVPPLPEHGAYVEHMTSLTTAMPLPWVVNVIAIGGLAWIGWSRLRRRGSPPSGPATAPGLEQWTLEAGSLASAAAMTVLVLTTVGITNRYLTDFYPVSALGMAIGGRLILPLLARRPAATAALGVVALAMVCWSVVVTMSLTVRLVLH